MTFPGDVLIGPLIRAIFGQPKPRREPMPMPDDRGYGGPDRRFSGWPHSYPVLSGRCPLWLAVFLGAAGLAFLFVLVAHGFWELSR